MKLHLPVLLRKALLACFAFTFACSATSAAADLTLGGDASLTIDYAAANSIPDLAGGTLQLSGDTVLLLSNCGVGDGKTYTLLTGVGALSDADGNPLTLTDVNNAASLYFDTSRPGSGFWADGWLQLASDGSVQLVLHAEDVQAALTITTRQTGNVYYSYYAGISFKNLTTTDSNGGAIYGNSITLSNNGSVVFAENTASGSSSAYGGVIYGNTITLSNNGSVVFDGNTVSGSTGAGSGGAIYGISSTITLSNNGSVVFAENTASGSSSACGGAIYGNTITLSNNGSVVFEGNKASSSSYAYGGAIYGIISSTITLSNNGSVVFEGNKASSYSSATGGAIFSISTITLSNNGSVVFEGNTTFSSTGSATGGAIDGSISTITLSNNGSVVFEGNKASSAASSYYSAHGGAIYGSSSTITLSNNGSVVFEGNTVSGSTGAGSGGAIYGSSSTITLSNNGSVVFEGNTASALGGAIRVSGESNGLIITGNALGQNEDGSAQQLLFENNHTKCTGGTRSAYGGAIDASDGSTLKINNNGETIFRGNYASSTQDYADGGAIRKQYGIFSIQNNASVVFEKNYTLEKETLRLRSIRAFDWDDAGREMVVNFSAPKDGKIEFRDSIRIGVDSHSASAFHLNNWYENDVREQLAQTGDIIFTGADATAENLKAILAVHGINREATADEIRLSKTSEVGGTMQLHDGRLIVRDGAVIEAVGITVHDSASGESTPTLWLDNGELSSYPYSPVRKNAISISGGSALRLSGQNTAMYSTLTLSTGSTLIIDVAATHAATAALTLDNGTLTLGGGITLQLNAAAGLDTAGRYMLLSGVAQPSNWDNVTVTGGVWNKDALSWVNNTLYLNYPTLTEATWNNASGDWVWNVDSSVNWEQHELNWAYRNGIGVIFGDEACGTVKLAGNLAPKSVLVNNSIGKDYVFSGIGSLTDSTKLTKEGTGKLTIQTSNSYTGGTEIKGGVLVVDNPKALGTGEVVLNGGTLEIGATGLDNSICNTGTSSLQTSAGITHKLTGTISNTDTLTLSGNYDVTNLGALTDHGVTYTEGGENGFKTSAAYSIKVVENIGNAKVNSSAVFKHDAINNHLTLDTNGIAVAQGMTDYSTYYITEGHSVYAVDMESYVDVDNPPEGFDPWSVRFVMSGGSLNTTALSGSSMSLMATGGTFIYAGGQIDAELSGTDLVLTTCRGGSVLTLKGTNTIIEGSTAISDLLNYGTLIVDVKGAELLFSGTVNEDSSVSYTHGNGNGFKISGGYIAEIVKNVDNGIVTVIGDAVFRHSGNVLYGDFTIHSDGIGRTGGKTEYSTYYINAGHSAQVDIIRSESGNKLTLVEMSGGLLNVDGDIEVKATGGSITITEAAVLSGSIENTAVSTAAGDYAAEISALLKENTTLEINGGVITVSCNNSYTGGTTLNNGNLTIAHANALGAGAIASTGVSKLVVDGLPYVLTGAISNTGTLTLSGSFDASALDYETKGSDERYALDGSVVGSDKSGFAVGVTYQVKVVDGGTSINDIATILHDSHAGSNALVLESDGYARANGDGSYSVFYLEGTDSMAVSTIAGVSSQHQEVLSKVIMDSGTLGVDQSITVAADGGSIIISKESELSGTIDDTAVSTGAGNYTGTISAVLGGRSSLAVGGGNIIVSGANSYTGGTSLNNGNLTITHANALGTGSISAEGISSLSVGNGVTLVLDKVIGNTGTLTLSGSFDASALQLNKTEAGRLSLSGERVGLTESGFSQGVEYTVLIVDGGSTVNAGAGISHKDYLSRTQLVLGEDGVARAGGAVDYTHFFLTGGDSAVVSEIADVSKLHQETLAGVTMDSGSLEVDQSITVSATGGSIVLTKAATLGGVIENTAVSSAVGNYSAEISALMSGDSALVVNGGVITVSGANSYTGGTQVNGGALMAGNAKAFGTGDVVVNGATLDLNRFSITNKVVMNGISTLGYADGASHIVLGSGAAVNFRDGYTLSGGKRLVVAGSASYTGALTLGGGTLELDGLLKVQGDVVFASGATTTLDISGWKGLDDGDVLADFGSSNSGYADGCLSLEGIAGEWNLAFEASTGVLTLVAVKDEPLPEPEFNPNLTPNQQVVYDTIKDIMGEGKPSGLLGQLGKEVTGTRDEATLKELLDALGGAEYATLMSSQQDAARGHMRRLRGSMGSGYALAGTKTRAYIEAYTNRSDVDGDASGRGYEMTENGGQFALEFLGEDKVSGGFAVASGRSKLQPEVGLTQKSNNTYVDAFLVCRDGAYTGKTSLGVGVHSYDLERQVMGNAVSAQADGSSVNFMHESAYAMALDESSSVQVFGAVESSMGKLGAFHEKGADTASLQVKSQDAWMTTLSAGARYHYSFAAVDAAPAATLSLQTGLEYKLGDTESEVEMSFSGARSHAFRQSGSKRDRFGYNVGASLHVPVSARAAVYASGDAVLRGDSREVNANLGVQMAF